MNGGEEKIKKKPQTAQRSGECVGNLTLPTSCVQCELQQIIVIKKMPLKGPESISAQRLVGNSLIVAQYTLAPVSCNLPWRIINDLNSGCFTHTYLITTAEQITYL